MRIKLGSGDMGLITGPGTISFEPLAKPVGVGNPVPTEADRGAPVLVIESSIEGLIALRWAINRAIKKQEDLENGST